MLFRTDDPAPRRPRLGFTERLAAWRNEDPADWFDGSVQSVERRIGACDGLITTARSAVADLPIGDCGEHLAALEELSGDREALASLREDLFNGAANRGEPIRLASLSPEHVNEIQHYLNLWDEGDKSNDQNAYGKYHFYSDTDHIPVDTIAQVSGINPDVIRMRRRDLNKMGPVSKWTQWAENDPPLPGLEDFGGNKRNYERAMAEWNRRKSGQKIGSRTHLSDADQRWVTLEAAKFFTDQDDRPARSELAERARRHADLQASALSPERSRVLTAAFVDQVAELDHRTPRQKVAAAPPGPPPDLPGELFFLSD